MIETDNIVLEQLRAIRRDLARMADEMVDIVAEAKTMRHDLAVYLERRGFGRSTLA